MLTELQRFGPELAAGRANLEPERHPHGAGLRLKCRLVPNGATTRGALQCRLAFEVSIFEKYTEALSE